MNPGGFIEHTTSSIIRPRWYPNALPDRGPFDFPAPYNTRGIRLTNGSDMGYQDALWYVGYSYWNNINAHQGQPHLYVFLSIDRQRGGQGPCLYRVDKATDEVTPLGPLFESTHPLSWASGEGWYWSDTDPNILFCSDLEHLYRYNLVSRQLETVLDITPFNSGMILWQWHSSHNGRVHSCTVKDGMTYQPVGSLVYREMIPSPDGLPCPIDPWRYYLKRGALDECHISKDGTWLLIKDNIDAQAGEDNLIIRHEDNFERIILDQQGAAGHSDNGFNYMVAADNYHTLPNAVRVWMFDQFDEPQGRVVYHGYNWDADLNHLSHGNARSDLPLEQQIVIGSGCSKNLQPRNNEIVAFKLDSRDDVLVIAPVMTDLNAPGGRDPYAKLPKGNVDVTGEYFVWTSNMGGSRLDAFLVKIPSHLIR